MKTRLERGKSMKKKGFTLIELLAVIVILAIIALIAVPVVMNIINRANESAFKDSAYGILKAGELYYTDQLLEAQGMTSDKVFDFSNETSELEINGSKPTGGTMTVRKDGKIAMAIHNGKHCVKKGFEDDDVTITDDIENCEISIPVLTLSDLATTYSFTSTDGTTTSEVSEVDECIKDKTEGACEAGTAFAINVNKDEIYKFYVLSDTGSEVTLIMDRNLYSSEKDVHIPWISLDDYKKALGTEEEYGKDGNNNKGPLTALRILKERTSGWTNIPKFTYTLKNDDDGYGGEYTYSDITGELVTDVRARLPRYEELYAVADSVLPPFWLCENLYYSDGENFDGYWTSTADSNYAIDAHSNALNGDVDPSLTRHSVSFTTNGYNLGNGIRPVITLSK